MTGTCPCNTQWENSCTMKDPFSGESYSWCQEKSFACPVQCADNEQTCWGAAYHANGTAIMETFGEGADAYSYPKYTESCQPAAQSCPCNAQAEHTCMEGSGEMAFILLTKSRWCL